jgi:DNA mismatch repair protein MSH6
MCSEYLPLSSSQEQGHMVMDSTVLSHLEILKDSEGSEKGSVLKFINRTITPFGSRLMQRWLCAPLADVARINERLDAVALLMSKTGTRKRLEEKLGSLPDLERKLQRISAMALQQQRNAIYFGEVETKRIAAFLAFLDAVESACGLVEWLHAETMENSPPSELLKKLTDPSICLHVRDKVQQLRAQVDVKKEGGYAPHAGAFKEYDDVVGALKALDVEFQSELGRVKSALNIRDSEINFVSVKFVKEIEIPADYENRLKKNELSLLSGSGEITSCRKGFVRFQTAEVKRLVEKHDLLEQEKKDLLYPFMAKLFSAANAEKPILTSLIDRIGTIDCLLSLAKVSGSKNWCRPVFSQESSSDDFKMTISLEQSRHPIQEYLMQLEREFVPNDISLEESTLIVTGANMGGKSTILRQVCINVILAQTGCFVPCKSMQLTCPVDRIFTRIGASDNILEGKSTFLTELEETAVMLKEATKRSLLVIDELGRGTSTYDGVAIAGATLKFINDQIGCNCLFATHYHKLCEENWGPSARLFHMECLLSAEGGEQNSIQLTHKFKEGLYPHSQALHVAKLAGLPPSILDQAKYISEKMFC